MALPPFAGKLAQFAGKLTHLEQGVARIGQRVATCAAGIASLLTLDHRPVPVIALMRIQDRTSLSMMIVGRRQQRDHLRQQCFTLTDVDPQRLRFVQRLLDALHRLGCPLQVVRLDAAPFAEAIQAKLELLVQPLTGGRRGCPSSAKAGTPGVASTSVKASSTASMTAPGVLPNLDFQDSDMVDPPIPLRD